MTIVSLFLSPSSCAWCTERPNKLKGQSLDRERFIAELAKEDWGSSCSKDLNCPLGFREAIFKGKVREGSCRVSDHLVHNSLIG